MTEGVNVEAQRRKLEPSGSFHIELPELSLGEYYAIIRARVQPTTMFATFIVILWVAAVGKLLRWSEGRRKKKQATPSDVPAQPRLPFQTDDQVGGVSEHYIAASRAGQRVNVTDAVSMGDSLLRIHALATDAECATLLKHGNAAAEVRRRVQSYTGRARVRMPIANFLDPAELDLCDQILRRALVRLGERPELSVLLARQMGVAVKAVRERIVGNPALQFSEGEPAINVYRAGGEFKPHEDKQRLTVLVALSDAASGSFTGGGTAYWSEMSPPEAQVIAPPTLIVHAPAGTALIFVGTVTHGAMPVLSGERAVFVASFGPKGEDGRRVESVGLLGALRGKLRV